MPKSKKMQNFRINLEKKASKFSQNAKKLAQNDDIKALGRFFAYVAINGIILNMGLALVFGLPFTLYTWLGYGALLWMTEFKLLNLLRRLWMR